MAQVDVRRTTRRVFVELAVIVVGVLIALAADRAFITMDEAATDRAHLDALVEDLARDSLSIAISLAWADSTLSRAAFALGAVRGQPVDQLPPGDVLFAIATLSYLNHPNYGTAAWNEVIASGSLLGTRYRSLRQALATYRANTEAWLDVEVDFEQRRDPIEEIITGGAGNPEVGAWLIERFIDDYGEPIGFGLSNGPTVRLAVEPTSQDVDAMIEYLASHPGFEAALTTAVSVSRLRLELYSGQLMACSQLLAQVRETAQGAS